MFKKFDEKESVSGISQLKSSVQKGIRKTISETYPALEQEHLNEFMPKKDSYRVVKCHEHLEILVNAAGTLLFFKHRDGPWIPTLRLLHEYPYMLVPQKVDKVRKEIRMYHKLCHLVVKGEKCIIALFHSALILLGCHQVCIVRSKYNVPRTNSPECKNDPSRERNGCCDIC